MEEQGGLEEFDPQLEKKLLSYSNMRKPDITDCNHLRGLHWRILFWVKKQTTLAQNSGILM